VTDPRILFTVWPEAGLLAIFALALACRSPGGGNSNDQGETIPAPPPSASTDTRRIVFLGDSLTAGYGLSPDEAFPSLLQERLNRAGSRLDVVNAGVSGDTSAGGRSRVEWNLEGDVAILVLALGANDGLRGLPVVEMKKNLGRIMEVARARGIDVLLAGMEAPPNQGEAYTTAFRDVFRELAREHGVPFLPFLLQDVAGVRTLNQADGVHPNVAGQRVIAENVWRHLEPMLDRRK
jgi:acyl-CoA thioesterase-1